MMDRELIIQLIRDEYDPQPNDWPRHRGWDDGAGRIADAILTTVEVTRHCPNCDQPFKYGDWVDSEMWCHRCWRQGFQELR